MSEYQAFSHESDTNRFIVDIFRLNGALVAYGDQIVRDLNLSSSKWQVLGTLAHATSPQSMPTIAFNMGLTRQGVRSILKPMLEDQLVVLIPNPLHKRSPHVTITAKGAKAYRDAMKRHAPFAKHLAAKISPQNLKACLKVIAAVLSEVNLKIADQT